MTQNDVAAALGVDQGTVSRWERGVEEPRPSNLAGLHKVLLAQERDRLGNNRVDTILGNNLYQAVFIDHRRRMTAFSDHAIAFYRQRHDIDLRSLLGSPFRTLFDRINQSGILRPIEQHKILEGIHLWSRCYTNSRGVVVCNEFEPVFESGVFMGTLLYASSRYRIVENDVRNIVKIEVVYLDDPGRVVTVHEGQFSEYIRFPGAPL